MIPRRRHDRRGPILLSAAFFLALPGCGALSLDRFAASSIEDAEEAMTRAIQLHQANQDEASRKELDNAERSLDRGLGFARGLDLQSELFTLTHEVAIAKRDRPLADRALARLVAIDPDSPTTAQIE